MAKSANPLYVWHDQLGEGRNIYACFRRVLELDGPAKSAVIKVFADSAYQLFVNGQFVDFGPVRFDPRFPTYDTHDIRKHLRPGKNVIAVSVNSFQHKTYKSIAHRAGFVAWGEVKAAGQAVIDLATPGEWRAIADGAHGRYVGKFSFALNAAELYDQAGEQAGWKQADFDDSRWPAAVVLADQGAWGKLKPRSIPFMSGTPLAIAGIKHLVPLCNKETRFSFAVPYPACYEDNAGDFSKFIAFATWVYSPVDQEVGVGLFWGEYYLNGQMLPRGQDGIIHNQRINQTWKLNGGWNHLFGSVGAYQDIVEQYFAVPADSGIRFNADRDEKSTCVFRHTLVLTQEQYKKFIADKAKPFSPDDTLAEIGGWQRVDASQPAQSPAREMGWDTFGEPVESLKLDSLQGHMFAHGKYPGGFSLLLDLGHTQLFLPQLTLEGVAGATIDLAYYEHLRADSMHLNLQHHHCCSDRILCTRESIEWMASHPRGGRYVMLTVRHAGGDVMLKSLNLRSAMYPTTQVGQFACSDPSLTAIWDMGRRTQATNMEDAYVDCVCRERGMYGRDTIIQYHVNLATFGDHALMGRCMELYGQSPDATGKFRAVYPNTKDYTIADFALNMVEGYLNYYHNSGDLERVRSDWQAILRNLQWFHNLSDERADKLLDADWPTKQGVAAFYGGFHGDGSASWYQSVKGVHCGLSCTYLMAIRAAMQLAKALGQTADFTALKHRAAILTKSIPDAFWDAARGCYADNIAHDSFAPHASLLAVMCEAATAKQIPLIRRYVAAQLQSVFVNGYGPENKCMLSPHYAYYLFDGLYRLGLPDTAESIMRQGWGWMLAQGLKTCAEYFTLESSHCHAWSASPTYYLSRHVLGVQFPKAPNMDVVEIRVQTNSVTRAEGAFPHPKGAIEVKWHTEAGRRVFDYVRAPAGVKVRIAKQASD